MFSAPFPEKVWIGKIADAGNEKSLVVLGDTIQLKTLTDSISLFSSGCCKQGNPFCPQFKLTTRSSYDSISLYITAEFQIGHLNTN